MVDSINPPLYNTIMALNNWDLLLVFAVTGMVLITANIENPLRKTFIPMLPIPFSLATLSLGIPIDATNITALLVLNIYYHLVRILHYKFGLNIVLAITAGAISYCLIGAGLVKIIPATSTAFWISSLLTITVSVILLKLMPNEEEPGNRTCLPVYIKAPLVAILVFGIITIKGYLLGFMTIFPMVGVFTTYETRKSLWTTCNSIPVISITMTVMFIIIKLSQNYLSIGMSLLTGWAGLLVLLIPYFILKSITEGEYNDKRR